MKITRGNLIDTIESWGPFFKITFGLKIHSLPTSEQGVSEDGYTSVLAFKGKSDRNIMNYGFRVPALYLGIQGDLQFRASIGDVADYQPPSIFNFNENNLDSWHYVEMYQTYSRNETVRDPTKI